MEENKKDFDESIVEENTSESSAEEQQEEASEKAAGADENAAGSMKAGSRLRLRCFPAIRPSFTGRMDCRV